MDTRRLGRTELTVPRLGLGTVKLGRNSGVKYPEPFELPDDASMEQLLDTALELGVCLVDTAPAYGLSEERLGPWVSRHRDRIVLCTKAGEEFYRTGSHHDFRASAVVASTERSLRRLRTGAVDLLLLHSDGRDREIMEETDAVEGLIRCREQGVAAAIGLSAKTAEGIRLAAANLDVVMAPFGAGRTELGPALADASGAGCGVLAIKALGQGHALRGSKGEDPLAAALAVPLRADFVDCVVVGTKSATHLRETVAAAGRALDPRD